MPTDVYLISDPRFTLVTGVDDTYRLENGDYTIISASENLIINAGQTLIIGDKYLTIKGSLENSGTITVNTDCDCFAEDGGVINNKDNANINVNTKSNSNFINNKINFKNKGEQPILSTKSNKSYKQKKKQKKQSKSSKNSLSNLNKAQMINLN